MTHHHTTDTQRGADDEMEGRGMAAETICGFGCGCDHDPARLCKVEVMAGRDVQQIIRQHAPWTSRADGRTYCGACWNDEGGPRRWPCDVAIVAAHYGEAR